MPLRSLLVAMLQLRLHRALARSMTAKQALQKVGRFLTHPRAVSTVNERDQGVAVLKGAAPSRRVTGGLGVRRSLQVVVRSCKEIGSGRDGNIQGPLCPFRAGSNYVCTVSGSLVRAYQLFNAYVPSNLTCEFSPGIAEAIVATHAWPIGTRVHCNSKDPVAGCREGRNSEACIDIAGPG